MVFAVLLAEEIGIVVSSVFIDKDLVSIVCYGIFVGPLTVVFLQKLRETETFRRNGLVELKIKRFMP